MQRNNTVVGGGEATGTGSFGAWGGAGHALRVILSPRNLKSSSFSVDDIENSSPMLCYVGLCVIHVDGTSQGLSDLF